MTRDSDPRYSGGSVGGLMGSGGCFSFGRLGVLPINCPAVRDCFFVVRVPISPSPCRRPRLPSDGLAFDTSRLIRAISYLPFSSIRLDVWRRPVLRSSDRDTYFFRTPPVARYAGDRRFRWKSQFEVAGLNSKSGDLESGSRLTLQLRKGYLSHPLATHGPRIVGRYEGLTFFSGSSYCLVLMSRILDAG